MVTTSGVMVSLPLCSGVDVAVDAMVTDASSRHRPMMMVMMMMLLRVVKVLLLSCLLVPLSRRDVGWRSGRLGPPGG